PYYVGTLIGVIFGNSLRTFSKWIPYEYIPVITGAREYRSTGQFSPRDSIDRIRMPLKFPNLLSIQRIPDSHCGIITSACQHQTVRQIPPRKCVYRTAVPSNG